MTNAPVGISGRGVFHSVYKFNYRSNNLNALIRLIFLYAA